MPRWLERLQEYHFDVEHRPGKSIQTLMTCLDDPVGIFDIVIGFPASYTVNGDWMEGTDYPALLVRWRLEDLARAQRDDSDIGPALPKETSSTSSTTGFGHPMQRVHMDIVGPLPKRKKGTIYIF